MIDAHLHFSNIALFQHTARTISRCDYSAQGLSAEWRANGIDMGIGMGLSESAGMDFPDTTATTPMTLDLAEPLPEGLFMCPGVNPHDLGNEALQRLEGMCRRKNVAGIKLYPGYYYFSPAESIYESVYDLARSYNLPVVIHSGEPYADRGLLKFAHPLEVDEVAVRHRQNRFVIAHCGCPWIIDAGEVTAKNPNVWMDLSGLLVGDTTHIDRFRNDDDYIAWLRQGLHYCASWERLLFGTDWPLAPVKPYLEFILEIIPPQYYDNVFNDNAMNLFDRLSGGSDVYTAKEAE